MNEFRKITSKDLIIKHGIKEFLDRGFRSASLRAIVKKAGLTTGAFYNYYGSKEELFNELVEPFEYHFMEIIKKSVEDVISESNSNGMILENYLDITSNAAGELFSYIYDHYENFLLLLSSSECTVHASFIDRIVDVISQTYAEVMRMCGRKGLSKEKVSPDMESLKLLAYSEFKTIFSIVKTEKKKELGIARMHVAKSFYSAGWKEMFVSSHVGRKI